MKLPLALLPRSDRRRDRSLDLLGRLWREHLIHHKGRLILVTALTLLMAGTTALYPVVINHAFDMFTARDQRILYQIPVLVVAITSVKAAAQYFQNVQVQQVVLLVIRELQERMFAHLTHADLARMERESPAQLASHFTTDAATIREALTKAVNGVADVITVVGLVASMIYLNWLLSLIAAALYPLAILPIERIGRRVRKASGGMQTRVGETATLLNESFAQARTVRAYRLEANETRRADAAFADLYKSLLRMTKSRSRVEPVLEVLGGAAVAAVIGFEGWRAATSDHALGDFTGFVAALLIAARPLRALGSLNAALQEGLAGMVRVFTIIDEEPSIRQAPDAMPLPLGLGHVVFDHVRFVYPDGRVGLHDLSFEALPGRTVALVGPSGGGKSTALALIPRLHDATAGAVRIDGADVRAVTLDSLRDAIAYVGQDALLFDDTVAANIAMGHPGADQAAIEAAAEHKLALVRLVDIRARSEMQQHDVKAGFCRLADHRLQRIGMDRQLDAGLRHQLRGMTGYGDADRFGANLARSRLNPNAGAVLHEESGDFTGLDDVDTESVAAVAGIGEHFLPRPVWQRHSAVGEPHHPRV